MKLVLLILFVVYLIQGYRLADLVHQNTQVEVSLSTMFFRSLNPFEPAYGFRGVLQNVWWLLIGKQRRVVNDLINSSHHENEFSELISRLNFISEKIMEGIIVSIATRGGGTMDDVRLKITTLLEEVATQTPTTPDSSEALSRIRSLVREKQMSFDVVMEDLFRMKERIKDDTIVQASRGKVER